MIQTYLICNFCQEEYNLSKKNPRMLTKCGHSICEECLLKKINEKIDFNCPFDYVVISPQYNLIDDFPKNLELMEIIEYENKGKNNIEINLSSKEEKTNSKKNKSFTNENVSNEKINFEEDNLSQENNFMNENSNFEITNFEEDNLSQENNFNERDNSDGENIELAYSSDSGIEDMCGLHVKELTIVCNECEKLICFDCALQNHKGHTFKNFEDMNMEIKNFKNKLEKFYLGIEKKTKNIKDEFFKIIYFPELKKRYTFLKNKVNQIYEEEIKFIETKKKNGLNKLKNIFEEKEKIADKNFNMKLSLDVEKIEIWKNKSKELFSKIKNHKKSNISKLMNIIKNSNDILFINGEEIYNKLRKNLSQFKKEIKKNLHNIKLTENIYKKIPEESPRDFYYKRNLINSKKNGYINLNINTSHKNLNINTSHKNFNIIKNKNNFNNNDLYHINKRNNLSHNKNYSLKNFQTNSVNNYQNSKKILKGSKKNLILSNSKLPQFLLQKNPQLNSSSNFLEDHSTDNNICSASFLKKNDKFSFNGFSSVHNLMNSKKKNYNNYFDKRLSNKRLPMVNNLKSDSLNSIFINNEKKDDNLLEISYVDVLEDLVREDKNQFSNLDIVYNDFYGDKNLVKEKKNKKINKFDKHNIYRNIKVQKKKANAKLKNDKKGLIKKKNKKKVKESNRFKNLEKQFLIYEPETLNLSNLKIKSHHLNSITKILNKSKNLKTLDLSKNKITDRGIKIFCSNFKKSKLKFIDFSDNLITESSFEFLLNYIEENIFLKNIKIENNHFDFNLIKKQKIVETFENKGVCLQL